MIDITLLATGDPLGAARKNINTAYTEIMRHQPMMGKCMNVSANTYKNGALLAAVTANKVTNTLNALIMPESNGAYVVSLKGSVLIDFSSSNIAPEDNPCFDTLTLDIASVVASGDTHSTFATPSHLGLSSIDLGGGKEGMPIQCVATSENINVRTVLATYYTVWKAYLVTDKNNPNTLEVQLKGTTNENFPGVPLAEKPSILIAF